MNAASIITKVQAEGGHIEACGGNAEIDSPQAFVGRLGGSDKSPQARIAGYSSPR